MSDYDAIRRLTDEQLAATIVDLRLLIEKIEQTEQNEPEYLRMLQEWQKLVTEQDIRKLSVAYETQTKARRARRRETE